MAVVPLSLKKFNYFILLFFNICSLFFEDEKLYSSLSLGGSFSAVPYLRIYGKYWRSYRDQESAYDLKNVYNIAYNYNFQHSQHSAFNSYILHLINWLVNHLTNFLTIVI